MVMKIKIFVFLLLILLSFLPGSVSAKNLYVAVNGSDGVSYDQNDLNHPWRTFGRAVSELRPGDTLLVRGGEYYLNQSVYTKTSGTSQQKIIIKNYPGENPIIIGDGIGELIFIENPYWVIDGLKLVGKNILNHDHAIITIGYDRDGSHAMIHNSTFQMLSADGHDNIACIRLQANRSNYAVIENNIISGIGIDSAEFYNCGIQYLGGGNVGTRIKNNEIYNCKLGIMVKHANADDSKTGAEIAFNYIHSCTHAFYGNPVSVNFHDNLLVDCDITLGDNGGGQQGHDNIISHNTVIGRLTLYNPSEGPVYSNVIKNNIFTGTVGLSIWASGNQSAHNNYLDYNLYMVGSKAILEYGDYYSLDSWKSHNGQDWYSITGDPNFVDDGSSIASYGLKDGSLGKGSAEDGKDVGADISLVGPQNNSVSPPGTPGNLHKLD